MRLELKLHPDCRCRAVAAIAAELTRPTPDQLRLSFLVSGAIDAIKLAPPAAPERVDELWKTTCFEAFVGEPGGSYTEFNFSPSTQWAAYHFQSYRAALQNAPVAAAPRIEVRLDKARLELRTLATVAAQAKRLALSAVIEETDGAKSYWALAHPPGKPDFHHSDSFAHEF
jgi:hypothetical protein